MLYVTKYANRISKIFSAMPLNNNNSKGEPICLKEFFPQLRCCFCPQ